MKLSEVEPVSFSDEVLRLVVDHLHSAAMRLDPTLTLPIPEHAGGMGLRPTAHALAAYARDGLPVWDWEDHGMAAQGLLDVLGALYGSALGDLSHTAIDVVDDVDPGDAVGLVLVAAAARVRLSQGSPVTARELAALTGMTARRVRQLMAAGELAATDERPARVDADDASRWLAARGVPGFR